MGDEDGYKHSGLRRKASLNVSFSVRKERDKRHLKITKILQKDENDRTAEDLELISSSSEIVKSVKLRIEKRKRLQARAEEFEDCQTVLEEKCLKLAAAIQNSQNLVIYSGAGVSTAASIPDYRGSNGIWTRLQQGKDIGNHDLSGAEPTMAHMALFELYKQGMLKHVVSQNCDGLHLRSGLPRRALSEVHGNMNLEVCKDCNIQVWRSFDVTQHTGRYAHHTARRCSQCFEPLKDTIVHFGERGSLAWPINWSGACHAAKQADMILCIGSSLKVLKKYPWLWGMDKPVKKRPLLYIINLQWTPKDDQATLKINGKCDEVMRLVMGYLQIDIPKYDKRLDPIFFHATILHELEEHTTTTQILSGPECEEEEMEVENVEVEVKNVIIETESIWRPFGNELILPKVECDVGEVKMEIVSPTVENALSQGFSIQVDFLDKVYHEITKKILRETNLEILNKFYEQPLDLSKPKTECDFCWDNYRTTLCQFYIRIDTKLRTDGPICYCCDSDEDNIETNSEDKKTVITNPGWFGKGYRKRIKKKR